MIKKAFKKNIKKFSMPTHPKPASAPSCAIVVSSFDGFSDLWGPFFTLFFHWAGRYERHTKISSICTRKTHIMCPFVYVPWPQHAVRRDGIGFDWQECRISRISSSGAVGCSCAEGGD